MNQIPTPKISEILKEEFMIPFNLSAYALAKAIHVPVSRIQEWQSLEHFGAGPPVGLDDNDVVFLFL